jgi:hypothetical protein
VRWPSGPPCCSSCSRNVLGLTPTAVFALATPKRHIHVLPQQNGASGGVGALLRNVAAFSSSEWQTGSRRLPHTQSRSGCQPASSWPSRQEWGECHKRRRNRRHWEGCASSECQAATCCRISFCGSALQSALITYQTQQLPVRPPPQFLFAGHPYSTQAVGQLISGSEL